MVKKTVKINTMQEADQFNKICSRFDCKVDYGDFQSESERTAGIDRRYG